MQKRTVPGTAFITLFIIAACFMLPGALWGQDKGNLYHWAYAPAFGTGAYTINDEKTAVLTFKPKVDLRKGKDHKIGVKLTLPLSFGFQTLNINNILADNITDHMTTASFVPGVELLVPVGRHWQVKPFGNIGWGTAYSSDESAWIFMAGAKSRYQFNWGRAALGLLNELVWAGYDPNQGQSDHFARFMLGLEADYPLGKVKFQKQQVFIRPHVLYYRYFNDLEFFFPEREGGLASNEEVELALSAGTKTPQKLWFFRPDRVGIGFRYGQELKGIRIFIRSAFY